MVSKAIFGWTDVAWQMRRLSRWMKPGKFHRGIWISPSLDGNSMRIYPGWWFGTWLLWLSIYWECHHPNWLIFFRGVGQPPTRGIYQITWAMNISEEKHQNHRMFWLGLTIKILGISFFQLMVDRLWGLWYLVNCGKSIATHKRDMFFPMSANQYCGMGWKGNGVHGSCNTHQLPIHQHWQSIRCCYINHKWYIANRPIGGLIINTVALCCLVVPRLKLRQAP